MDFNQDQLTLFKEHEKTQWLAGQFERDLEKLEEAKALAATDPDMAELAEEEITALTTSLEAQYTEMQRIIEASKEEEKKPYGVVLEVRAGAGGDEASLFAEELANMYLKYAEKQGWQTLRLSVSDSAAGGYKEAAFEILGAEVYDHLRYETGVHRVQRVPVTEKQGRIHTSTAAIAASHAESPPVKSA